MERYFFIAWQGETESNKHIRGNTSYTCEGFFNRKQVEIDILHQFNKHKDSWEKCYSLSITFFAEITESDFIDFNK